MAAKGVGVEGVSFSASTVILEKLDPLNFSRMNIAAHVALIQWIAAFAGMMENV